MRDRSRSGAHERGSRPGGEGRPRFRSGILVGFGVLLGLGVLIALGVLLGLGLLVGFGVLVGLGNRL
ncbi:hypothetical protein [Streptosporangium carneum]|uniref:hypothetical protein n=1 Tax=Streptosporangium carneum TaxID=47481 RepID=UPI0022F2D305|nr:hypothetical protein [Streptosporangium carneum]